MAELKPCPFCGGEADCNNAGFLKNGKPMWAVECVNCGMVTAFFYTDSEAIEVWNKRTEPERPKGRWIPVTERLPEKHGGDYVCLLKFPNANKPFPYCLIWHAYGDNGYVNGPHFSDEGLDGMKVTHWMPLPEPPKEDAE